MIQPNFNQTVCFLVMLSSREDGLVIRIYPGSSVEKTNSVKKILAEIAKQLLGTFPNLKVGKTNLQSFSERFERKMEGRVLGFECFSQ